ncbi:hypothetical protein ACHAXR_009641 [Thalassiosira sp. AJA248-18]
MLVASKREALVSGFASPPWALTRTKSKFTPNNRLRWESPNGLAHNYFSRLHRSKVSELRSDLSGKNLPEKNSIDFPLNKDEIKQVVGKTTPKAQTVFASVVLGLVLIFSGPLPHANAGFGPSSRAVTSPPPNLIAPSVSSTSGKKLKQLIGSTLDANRLEQFSIQLESQLDDLAESLSNLLSIDDTLEGEEPPVIDKAAIEQREAELEKARTFQKQIVDRELILGKLEKQPYWFNYLAAFIGSVASTLAMHPLDTIKTRLQVNKSDDSEEVEGFGNILSLYEGLSGNILKEGPASALYLGVYESVKYSLLPLMGPQSVLMVYLISGAAGEMVGSIIRAPAEAIKSTVQSGISGSAVEAAVQVFGTAESRANIVRAWSSSIWRDVPFGAIQLAIFELIKAYILNNEAIDFDSSTLLAEAVIGAFAGGVGAFLTNPFDIITTRIITQEVDGESEPLGVLEMGKALYDEGGPTAFLVGWQARVGYWAPAISIFLSCYCSVRQTGVLQGWFTS